MFYVFFGIIFPIMGFYAAFIFWRMMKNGIVVKAKIIAFEKEWSVRGSNIRRLSFPVVHYVTVDGKEFKIKLEYGTSWNTLRVGQIIDIIYLVKDPGRATRYLPDLPKYIFGGTLVWILICLVVKLSGIELSSLN